MVPINVLAIQIGMVEQQVLAIADQIKRHRAAEASSTSVDADVVKAFNHALGAMGLECAARVLTCAVEELRHVQRMREQSADLATLRQVEVRA